MTKVWTAIAASLLAGCDLADAFVERQAISRAEFAFKTAEITRLDVPLANPHPGAELAITLDVKNPNRVAALLDRFDYTFKLQGEEVATGRIPGEFRIEPGGARDLVLPLAVRYTELPGPALDALRKREAVVGIRGTSHMSTPLGTLNFPLEIEQRLPLLDVQPQAGIR